MTLNERREAEIRARCAALGIEIRPEGRRAHRLVGNGINIVAADLAVVTLEDLTPPRKSWANRGHRR